MWVPMVGSTVYVQMHLILFVYIVSPCFKILAVQAVFFVSSIARPERMELFESRDSLRFTFLGFLGIVSGRRGGDSPNLP